MSVKPKHTVFETNFTVLPKHCNYTGDHLFGGELLAQMDLAAARAVTRAMYDSEHHNAVTVAVNKVSFYYGAKLKDLLFLTATITRTGIKSIDIHVHVTMENDRGEIKKVADGDFVFVAMDEKWNAVPHGLELIGS